MAWIKQVLCAVRGHGGIGNDGRCKKCCAKVDPRPRQWRKKGADNDR